jgi:putative colanic acid biosynthesis UDP-glucose lipid carrier transferase
MFPRGLLKQYASVLSIIAQGQDILAVILGAIIAYAWRFGHINLPGNVQIAILLASLLALGLFPMFGLYQSWRGKSRFIHLRTLTSAWVTVFIILVLIAFLTKTSTTISRQWAMAWAFSAWILLIAMRVVFGQVLRLMRENGLNHKSVIILGAGSLGREVLRRINTAAWTGLDVVTFLDDNESLHGKIVDGVTVKGPISLAASISVKERPDEIWIALPLYAEKRVKTILHELRHSTATIRYVPDIFGFRLINHSVTEIAGMAVLDLSASPMVGINRVVKAFEDKALALLIIMLISPLMLLIALGIKVTSRGPIIFKQLRHGWDGKPVKVYKFRTMVVHKEEPGCVTQACKNDARITKFGAFLRATSLDELPQFFNVLQGRMSIVGPRPHAIAHNELYKDQIDDYMKRHKVKPGITGWAQINGWRGETDTLDKMKKRVEYDLYYIENWSLWFDLKIIIRTLFTGFGHKNAY